MTSICTWRMAMATVWRFRGAGVVGGSTQGFHLAVQRPQVAEAFVAQVEARRVLAQDGDLGAQLVQGPAVRPVDAPDGQAQGAAGDERNEDDLLPEQDGAGAATE